MAKNTNAASKERFSFLRGGKRTERTEGVDFYDYNLLAVVILLTCFGLLSLVSEQGAFDGIGFTVRKAFGQIRSEAKRAQMPKTYYDYVTGKQETQRKKPLGTLYVGLAFLAMAAAALAVYLAKF